MQIIHEISLYSKDSKNNIRCWKATASIGRIEYEYGLVGGAVTRSSETINSGLAGRNLEEQTLLKLNSRVKNKLDRGYVQNIEDAKNNKKVNQLGLPLPMKAANIKNYNGKLPDIVFCQRKYNGNRCMIINDNGNKLAYTRKGIIIDSITELLKEVEVPEGFILDGELYHHGTPLQTINSWIKKNQPETANLQFICFDILTKGNFETRYKILQQLRAHETNRFKIAETIVISSKSIFEFRDIFRDEGYEGAIVRLPDGLYEDGKRSKHVIKVKKVLDAEFLITGIVESVDGYAILICLTDKGKKFRTLAPGSSYEKTAILKNKENYINKFVQVEFAEWTKDEKPSQPIAIRFRNPSED